MRTKNNIFQNIRDTVYGTEIVELKPINEIKHKETPIIAVDMFKVRS